MEEGQTDACECASGGVLGVFSEAGVGCDLRVFGSQLGLGTIHLDGVGGLPFEQRTARILTRYSGSVQQPLSWPLLVSVLRKPALKEFSAADYIERRYCRADGALMSPVSDSSFDSSQLPLLRSFSSSVSSQEASISSYTETELTIQKVVNEIAEVLNWEELGIFLGLESTDIEKIRIDYHDPKEHHQRLVEIWFARDPKRSWEKLHRAMEDASASRRGSASSAASSSLYNISPTTPTSPNEIIIISKIDKFEKRFEDLQFEARQEIEEKKKSVKMVRKKLTVFPRRIMRQHHKYITKIVKKKQTFFNLDHFFACLNNYCWDFFEYKLLKHVIERFCSRYLKNKMASYDRDMQIFQQQTTVFDFIKFGRHTITAETNPEPPGFRSLVLSQDIDPKSYTLADLEKFRMDTCTTLNLSECALQLYIIKHNCIIVGWLIPEELTDQLSCFFCSEEGQEILLSHHVEKATIDGKTLLSWMLLACVKKFESEKAMLILQERFTDDMDLNCQDNENGRTALFHAAVGGNVDLVKKLLERGADLTLGDSDGRTTLMVAVENGHAEVVKVVLEPLYQCETNIQEKLYGWTALHFAADNGREDIIQLLINPVLHTDVMLTDKNGRTAIQIAEKKEHLNVVELFLQETDVEPSSIAEEETEQTRQDAPRVSRLKKLLLKIPWPQKKKKYSLINATKSGSISDVMKLLEEGENPNSYEDNKSQWTPLLYASDNGNQEIVELLLKKKANPNWRSADEGYTALILAGYKGYVEILQLLLRYDAKVNIQTKVTLQTSLQKVCLYTPARYKKAKHPPSERRCEVVTLLLEHKADIRLVDEQNRTPLIAASKSGFSGIVKILLEKIKEFPEDERQEYLDHEMNHSWTALMEASEEGHEEIVRMLIHAGASLKQKKKDNVTALHIAVQHRRTAVVMEIVKRNKGIKEILDARDHYGMTPLILATKDKNEEIIYILLHAGADLNLQTDDADKMTALMYAVKHGAKDAIKILVKHKANLLIKDAKQRTASDMAKSSAIKRFFYEEIQQEQKQLAQVTHSQPSQAVV